MASHPKNERREPNAASSESPTPPAAVGRSVAPKAPGTPLIGAPFFARLGRVARWTVGAAVVVVTSGFVALGAKRYMHESPRFSIADVTVTGNVRLSEDAVLSLGDVSRGANIFSLDTDQAREKIETDPWISSAVVTRKLPGSIMISVEEHEARALVALDGQLFLASSSGVVFKQVGDTDPMDLPVVTGIGAKDIATDREGAQKRIGAALDLLAEIEALGFGKRYPVQEINLMPDGTQSVLLGQNGIALHLGVPPYRGKLEQAERVFAELSQRKTEPSIVFLDNESSPERVVIRMR